MADEPRRPPPPEPIDFRRPSHRRPPRWLLADGLAAAGRGQSPRPPPGGTPGTAAPLKHSRKVPSRQPPRGTLNRGRIGTGESVRASRGRSNEASKRHTQVGFRHCFGRCWSFSRGSSVYKSRAGRAVRVTMAALRMAGGKSLPFSPRRRVNPSLSYTGKGRGHGGRR